MTSRTATVLSSLAYLVVTFPLAILWHRVLFKVPYEEIGYIGREDPIFVFGFISIAMQGILLSLGYLVFAKSEHSIGRGIRYALAVGVFFWTSHVLAFAAKGDINRLELFFPLESIYLLLQFGIYGIILGLLHSDRKPGKVTE